jgi:hypothetical protein
MQDYIESAQSLPKARIQDLFKRKNMYAITLKNFFSFLFRCTLSPPPPPLKDKTRNLWRKPLFPGM